jgi:uncharacterized protein (TIGR00251 family)
MKITETKNGAVIEVFVKTNQPQFAVKLDGDEIILLCTNEPVKGKVNKEIIKELSGLFHTQIEIILGLTSKQKWLLVRNISKNHAESLLQAKSV